MSCNFNVKKCINCGKYNGCLLQTIYTNVSNLTNIIDSLSNKQNDIISSTLLSTKSDIAIEDSISIDTNIDDINKKLNIITTMLKDYEMDRDELNIDISQIKSTLTRIELKVDTLYEAVTHTLLK